MAKPQLKIVSHGLVTDPKVGFIYAHSENTLNSLMNALTLIKELQYAELDGDIELSVQAKYAIAEITDMAIDAVKHEYQKHQPGGEHSSVASA